MALLKTEQTATGPLSSAQVDQFVRDGYVRVPGLIPADIATACAERMWEALEIDPRNRETWPDEPVIVPHQVNPLMAPCRTAAIEAAAEQIVGPDFRRGGGFSPVLNFPRAGEPVFQPMGFHIDGINESTLWPVRRYLVLLAYLSDTAEYGGALAVRPGSHRQAFAHWVRTNGDPAGNTVAPELDYAEPIPLSGKAGDVIFMHYLMVHGSSHNHSDHVRIGLNGTIIPKNVPTAHPKAGPPQPDWTPLDWTLRIDNLQDASGA